jgi:pyruvate kinase
MRTRTKIICTIGPSVESLEQLIQLINNGMDVARLNFSHGTHEEHREKVRKLKEARAICKRPLGIMIDTKGPEIRTGAVKGSGINVEPGDRLLLVKNVVEGTKEALTIRPGIVLDYLKVGTEILIDNGYIQSHVVEIKPEGVIVEFRNSGTILSSKGVNIPDIEVPLPTLTEKDISDIQFGCEEGCDLIAASFIRNAENILEIKRLLNRFKRPDMLVFAKIESTEGVKNFDSILQVADGIMVARGDLGVEVPLSQVPRLQKMMIRKCNLIGKPVVTATQMLESMMGNPRPTRAEVSDVANAIYDGTSAVMLSGETAVGSYPQETVKIMKSVASEAEQDFDYRTFFDAHAKLTYHDIPSAITLASVKTAYSLEAKAIFTFSHSGATARLLARMKPKMPIIALTPDISTYHQLAICWGVTPVLCDKPCSTVEEAFQYASEWGLKHEIVSYGDLVVLTAGSPFWVPGTSNTILVDSIGDVLLRGERGYGERIHGVVSLIPGTIPTKPVSARGCIVVFSSFDESLIPFLHESVGAILQSAPDDRVSAPKLIEACQREGKTVVVGVDGAFRVLREKQLVTIEPHKALVYKGVVR